MSWLDKALEFGAMLDLFGNVADIAHSVDPNYTTIELPFDGRSANEMAKDLGPGWSVGFIDHDAKLVRFHRHK